MAENNEEAREEVTRQLNKAMIDDWDYQRQLKKGQMDEVDAREHTDAINGMQVNQAALDQEALKGENNAWVRVDMVGTNHNKVLTQ